MAGRSRDRFLRLKTSGVKSYGKRREDGLRMGAKSKEENKGPIDESGNGSLEICKGCLFSWNKLVEMKNDKVQFFAGDGYKRLRIMEVNEKKESIHMVDELGKITWPFRFKKLEEIHQKVHSREVALIPYEIDRLIPTWGNYITGLLKYLGCDQDKNNPL